MKEYILTKPKIQDFKKMLLYRLSYFTSLDAPSIKKVFNKDIDGLKELLKWLGDQGVDYVPYRREVRKTIEWKKEELEEELGKLQTGIF